MFWDNFYNLCIERNLKPNPVAKELGISSGAVTKWKTGTLPSCEALIKLANYFDVTIDSLLGIEKTLSGGYPEERSEKPIIKSNRDYFADMFRKLSNDELLELQNYVGYLMYKKDNPTVD